MNRSSGRTRSPAVGRAGERGGISIEWLAIAAVVVVVLAAVASGGMGQRIAVAVGDIVCNATSVSGDATCGGGSEDRDSSPDGESPSDTDRSPDAPGPGPDDGAAAPPGNDDAQDDDVGPRPDLDPRPDRPEPDREVEDLQNGDRRDEGDGPSGNDDVDDLYQHLEDFDRYLWDAFGRDGFDGAGGTMRAFANDPDRELNAYYNPGAWWGFGWAFGHERTGYGPGMATADIVAHELAHGLVHHEVDLDKSGDNHALNEALADMFASNMVDSWQIGEGSAGGIIRDMEDPERDGHPAHVDDFIVPTDRTNNQHANAGIPNHAYYLMTEQIGRGDAEQILYRAVTEHLTSDGGFEGFRTAMLDAADELHGSDSDQRRAVNEAFAEVGLDGTWEAPS